MASATIAGGSDTRAPREITAHHTIGVEPFTDRRCPEVRAAVVERYAGEVVCICCRDVDVLRGASLDDVAHVYAAQFEADYVVTVTA